MENTTNKLSWMIAVDIETGGIGDDKSILTAYFAFLKYDKGIFTQLDELDLKIKPNDAIYRVTAESLEINHIDLKQHDKQAITEKQAGTKLYDKLRLWYADSSSNKLIPIGHNVTFDIRRVTNTLVSIGSWDQYVSYRVLDTCTIAQFLRMKGDLPATLSCSLTGLSEYFNVQVDGIPHEAKYDTLVTVKVLENLLKV